MLPQRPFKRAIYADSAMSRFNNRNIVTEQELESFLSVGSSLALADHSEAVLDFGNLECSEFTDVILVSFTLSVSVDKLTIIRIIVSFGKRILGTGSR